MSPLTRDNAYEMRKAAWRMVEDRAHLPYLTNIATEELGPSELSRAASFQFVQAIARVITRRGIDWASDVNRHQFPADL